MKRRSSDRTIKKLAAIGAALYFGCAAWVIATLFDLATL